MKVVTTALLDQNFAEHSALFFTADGSIITRQNASPLMPFEKTAKELKLIISAVYLDKSVLVVKCQNSLTPEEILNRGFHLSSIKPFLASLALQHKDELQALILRAVHWLGWDERLQYCSQCSGSIYKISDSVEKRCAACELSFFPKLSPAVMVLIQRKNEILLARSPHFKAGVYSAIAGFIDIGESAEHAAHREVKEEVGLEIAQLSYFGSQSWPFPDSFMIAFKAQYAEGELNIDPTEIEDARWFNINNLPELPPSASISRRLIDHSISELASLG